MGLSTTIGEALERHAARDAAAPAIVCPGLANLTFGALDRRIKEIGAQLRAAGLGSTSRIGIALPRGPEAALLSLAVCASAIALPINPNLSAEDLSVELETIRLDALIVPAWSDLPAWVTAANSAFGLFKVSRAVGSFDDIALGQLRSVVRVQPAVLPSVPSLAVIFRTSGTTGVAKRVPVTHENLLEMARKMALWLGLTPADRGASILPLHYNAGFKATLVAPLLIGCSVALPVTSSPLELAGWLEELRPTWLTAAPPFLQAMLDRVRGLPRGALDHRLRFVLSTASYLPERVRGGLQEALGVPVVEFYGLCEAGMMTAPPLPRAKALPGTVGRIPEGELAIRGDTGEILSAGRVGQVVLRGPSVTPGYLREIDGMPTGLEDGWLPTGDLGSVDTNGDLTIVGRTKEIINRGGEKISPYDVEKALLRHPAVREAASFAVPHPRLGENVGAAVVLHAGQTATSSQLLAFLHDRLAPFQMPRHVHLVDSLPVGVTGKISRPQLAALLVNQRRHIELPDEPLQIQISEIWHRLLGRTDIGVDDDFFEMGGDSLQATEMLLALEALIHHRLEPSDIKTELTIRQLTYALVSAAAARAELLTKVKDGSGTPLFLCHGDYDGWGFYAVRLADLLKDEGPVYLLHSNLDPRHGVSTIEDMARGHVSQLLKTLPSGTFRLAGYCHGGLAAWEIAHQLARAGRKVETIVLIDTFSINARPLLRLVAHATRIAGALTPGAFGAKLRNGGMAVVWKVARKLMQKDRAVLVRAARNFHVGPSMGTSLRSAYYRAMSRYLPPRVDTDVVCLLSDEYWVKKEYAPGPWRHVALSVSAESTPGKHNTCITSHVSALASRMSRMLAA
jgi:oxalate---CoA ligase